MACTSNLKIKCLLQSQLERKTQATSVKQNSVIVYGSQFSKWKKKLKNYTSNYIKKRKKHFMKGFYQCCYNHWINWQRGWLPWLPCSVDGQIVAWQQPCACSIWDKNADWLGNKEDCTKGIYTENEKFPWIQEISNKMKEFQTERIQIRQNVS